MKKRPWKDPRATKLTRYHLDSQIQKLVEIATPVCALVRNDTAFFSASTRFNGRTRDPLPIEDPAPGPCSAIPLRTRSHLPGLSDRLLWHTLPFTAFSIVCAIIARKRGLCQHPREIIVYFTKWNALRALASFGCRGTDRHTCLRTGSR